MSGKILILTTCVTLISILQAFDMQIERPDVHYVDKQYFKYIKVSVRRVNRKSPYLVHTELYLLHYMENNVSISVQLFENLSGRYLPTLFNLHWKLCDFYNNEPYVGQLLKNQIPINVTCPHDAGLIVFPPLAVKFDKFPYVMPLTWPFTTTSARLDFTLMLTESQKPIAVIYIYMKILNKSGAKAGKTV